MDKDKIAIAYQHLLTDYSQAKVRLTNLGELLIISTEQFKEITGYNANNPGDGEITREQLAQLRACKGVRTNTAAIG